MSAAADIDDFLIVEDIDVSDDTELRRVVAEVEALVGLRGRGLRVSILSTDQWQTVLGQMLPASKAGADRFVHAVAHRREPLHLLFSPTAVSGVNERSRVLTAEVVYTVLRTLPSPLAARDPLRRGVDELFAEEVARRLELPFFTRHYPGEAAVVRALVEVLAADYGHAPLNWLRLLHSAPDQFFLALRKSRFCQPWAQALTGDAAFREMLLAAPNRRDQLIALLTSCRLHTSDPLAQLTIKAAEKYLAGKTAKPKSARGSKAGAKTKAERA